MVALRAVAPQRGLSPSGASVHWKAAQLNSKPELPQFLKETSSLAFGVQKAPRYNSTSHLLRLRQEACQPLL